MFIHYAPLFILIAAFRLASTDNYHVGEWLWNYYWNSFTVTIPSREFASCVVLTRLALGGAWLANLNASDVLCPPQFHDVCFWIWYKEKRTRDEGQLLCGEYGLVLWTPFNTAEEILMKEIMRYRKFSVLVLGIIAVDNVTITDMRDQVISHDNFENFQVFDPNKCFYFHANHQYWSVDDCTERTPTICSIH
ncbi:hypothetical protein CRM22_001723 [Opisthorchis felineus]|uniref:C-type lectin domain-containing protein n=1 Tax=Opisthorchis felineus TaxID=147828 RepID=A0A4S2MF88_OPIFE|nr:hypothetical protein CRM22_001723 [Opisthorchis felineus]